MWMRKFWTYLINTSLMAPQVSNPSLDLFISSSGALCHLQLLRCNPHRFAWHNIRIYSMDSEYYADTLSKARDKIKKFTLRDLIILSPVYDKCFEVYSVKSGFRRVLKQNRYFRMYEALNMIWELGGGHLVRTSDRQLWGINFTVMKISTSGKTCRECDNDTLHRKFKSRWMRLIQVSKYYKCANCNHEIIVLFGYGFDYRLPLHWLIAIVSFVFAILLLWGLVFVACEVGYNDRTYSEPISHRGWVN
jgi:hypothetical protein